jgi:hypothetical protein
MSNGDPHKESMMEVRNDRDRDLLEAFDWLPPAEKQQIAAEILRRSVGPDDISEAALHELTAELFHGYDNEDATPMPSPKRPGLS